MARWAQHQYIHSIPLPGAGKRQYRLYDVSRVAWSDPERRAIEIASTQESINTAALNAPSAARGAIYARHQGAAASPCPGTVSTRKQAGDLERQIQYLRERHPDVPVYSDIASGLNFHRRGLQRLLENALAGRVRTVYVAHRDRLCRFAPRPTSLGRGALQPYDLIAFVLQRCGAHIVVDSPAEAAASDWGNERDLAEDVLSVVTVFGARLYGGRSRGGGRKRRQQPLPPTPGDEATPTSDAAHDAQPARERPTGVPRSG